MFSYFFLLHNNANYLYLHGGLYLLSLPSKKQEEPMLSDNFVIFQERFLKLLFTIGNDINNSGKQNKQTHKINKHQTKTRK